VDVPDVSTGRARKPTSIQFFNARPPRALALPLKFSGHRHVPLAALSSRYQLGPSFEKGAAMTAIGPLRMPRPATVASGYRGTAGMTLTFDCNSRRINQKHAWRLCALVSGIEASSSMPTTKLGGGN
jgi:hypothetical protein